MRHLRNIFNLGIKELRSLLGDKAMLTLIVFSFTVSVYSSATVTPGSLNLAPIAIADMDQSQLSNRIVNSFYRPWFLPPEMITADEMDAAAGKAEKTYTIASRCGVFAKSDIQPLLNQGARKEDIAASIPMGRLADPKEIGELAAFLGSDEASYITGQGIVIDGGSTLPETSSMGV